MAEINKVNIGGTNFDIQDVTSGYSQIEISNLLSSGVALGTITLDGQDYIIYAPNESSSSGLDVLVGGNNLILVNQNQSSSSIVLYDGIINYIADGDNTPYTLNYPFSGHFDEFYSVELDGTLLDIYDIIEDNDNDIVQLQMTPSEDEGEGDEFAYPMFITLETNQFWLEGALHYGETEYYPGDLENHTLKIIWTPNDENQN